jgi:hypothetical protein
LTKSWYNPSIKAGDELVMYEKSFMNQRLRKGELDDKYRVKNGKIGSQMVRFHSFFCEIHANSPGFVQQGG